MDEKKLNNAINAFEAEGAKSAEGVKENAAQENAPARRPMVRAGGAERPKTGAGQKTEAVALAAAAKPPKPAPSARVENPAKPPAEKQPPGMAKSPPAAPRQKYSPQRTQENKAGKSKKASPVGAVLMAVGAVGLAVAVFMLVRIGIEYSKAEKEYDGLAAGFTAPGIKVDDMFGGEFSPLEIDAKSLLEINEDFVCWIEIPGVDISYPVVQAANNSYYLNRTYNGEINSSGAIFMDSRCNADLSDVHTIIYGHHMRNKTMFSGLDSFFSKTFLAENPAIRIYTEDKIYTYEIKLAATIPGDYILYGIVEGAAAESSLISAMDDILQAHGASAGSGERFLTLSTCTYDGDDELRNVVIATLRGVKDR